MHLIVDSPGGPGNNLANVVLARDLLVDNLTLRAYAVVYGVNSALATGSLSQFATFAAASPCIEVTLPFVNGTVSNRRSDRLYLPVSTAAATSPIQPVNTSLTIPERRIFRQFQIGVWQHNGPNAAATEFTPRCVDAPYFLPWQLHLYFEYDEYQ